ncbi:hypothetical protein DFH28DRAFT_878355 [Melampsora americana]|nr:hypothetical protein DFH28DRAFT_878355 [Melampsora americana]
MNSTQPFSPLKQKSLPIFSHARDPSIPRICLSPDSDEEDDCNDQSDETQSEPPCSAIPMILDSSALKSANPSLEPHRLDFNCTLIASSTPSPSNHRALQRQALLTNLALARRRRTTNETSTPQYVAPV